MSGTILLVENYIGTRELMRFLLQIKNFQVIEAINGQQAIETAKQKIPDLILMDIGLPIINGITAIEQIRKLDKCKVVPIIAMTAFGNKFNQQAFQAGCNEIITKPIIFDSLIQVISGYLF